MDPRAFRRRLAAGIAGALGTAALAACSTHHAGTGAGTGGADAGHAGTGGAGGTAGKATGTGGTAGMPGTGGTASTGGAGGAGGAGGSSLSGLVSSSPMTECLPWAADAGSCPTNHTDVLEDFLALGCPSGWFPYIVDSGPTVQPDACCYVVVQTLCPGGGRPFLVEGQPRVASPVTGSGWSEGAPVRLDGLDALDALDPSTRAALAAAWTEDALAEHASVASFARLALALLAAGAPADLVARAHEAAIEEVRHARLCFALSSAYAGREIAPGPFPLGGGADVAASLVDLAVSSVKEGCVGETVAAVLAAEQAARAADPAVRAALEEIAADEARHAELGWRVAAWAVRAGGAEVRDAAARALFEALVDAAAARRRGDAGEAPEGLEAHGRLGAASAREAVRAALVEVVGPCAGGLGIGLACAPTGAAASAFS